MPAELSCVICGGVVLLPQGYVRVYACVCERCGLRDNWIKSRFCWKIIIILEKNHVGNNLVQTQSLDSSKQFFSQDVSTWPVQVFISFWKANLTIQLLSNKSRSSLRAGCGKPLHEVFYFTYYHGFVTLVLSYKSFRGRMREKKSTQGVFNKQLSWF